MFVFIALLWFITTTTTEGYCPIPIPENVTGVSCSRRNLKSIPRLHPRLVVVYLSNNKISSIPNGTFVNLTSLRDLYLSYNKISSIPKGTFVNLRSLLYLSLSSNQISMISNGAFVNLPSLSSLYLSYNKISSIPKGTFVNLRSLRYLSLLNNKISSIPKGTFVNLTSLQDLRLSSNNISLIPKGTFGNLRSLRELDIDASKIFCPCDLKGIEVPRKISPDLSTNETCIKLWAVSGRELKKFENTSLCEIGASAHPLTSAVTTMIVTTTTLKQSAKQFTTSVTMTTPTSTHGGEMQQ